MKASFEKMFSLFCFSPVTQKRIVISQHLGGIEKNATNHIVKAEATSMTYGVKFSPELNEGQGRLVGLFFSVVSV